MASFLPGDSNRNQEDENLEEELEEVTKKFKNTRIHNKRSPSKETREEFPSPGGIGGPRRAIKGRRAEQRKKKNLDEVQKKLQEDVNTEYLNDRSGNFSPGGKRGSTCDKGDLDSSRKYLPDEFKMMQKGPYSPSTWDDDDDDSSTKKLRVLQNLGQNLGQPKVW